MHRIQQFLTTLFTGAILFLHPLMVLAVDQDEKEPPEWVLSYFLLLLFLGLAILILLRPGGRRESAKTQEEIDAEIAEKAKIKKH